MVEEFELDAHTDAAPLKKAIKATKFEGGWTMTATAMKNALTHYSAKMRNDKQTTKACIVFTDGEASDKPALPAALKAWESKGIKVFAVGIGLKIDAAGLKAITGSTNRFIQVPSIEAFTEAVAKSLLFKVCEEAIAPTRPLNWRNDLRCGENFLKDGLPAICHPHGLYCCSNLGWCGTSTAHCKCKGCMDYSNLKNAVAAPQSGWRN